MSRIGKKSILIPEGVEVEIKGQKVTVKSSKGEIAQEIRPEIKVEIINLLAGGKEIKLSPQKQTKQTKAFWGLSRALLSNMIQGITDGFEKKLEIQGIGFRAVIEEENIVLNVGFSHPIRVKIPKDIKVSVEKNIITVSGISKELVGLISAVIRKTKPPEPYKGKGIRYLGEQVRRKVGKRVVTAAGQ